MMVVVVKGVMLIIIIVVRCGFLHFLGEEEGAEVVGGVGGEGTYTPIPLAPKATNLLLFSAKFGI